MKIKVKTKVGTVIVKLSPGEDAHVPVSTKDGDQVGYINIMTWERTAAPASWSFDSQAVGTFSTTSYDKPDSVEVSVHIDYGDNDYSVQLKHKTVSLCETCVTFKDKTKISYE